MLKFVNCTLWTVVLIMFSISEQTMKANSVLYDTIYACDGKWLKIECKEGHVINIIRANYGRFSISVCNDHGSTEWSVNCMSNKALNLLQMRCNQKRNCSIQASSQLLGDPCSGTVKYLEAHYMCISAISAPSTSRPAPPWLITSQPSVWSTALFPEIAVPATPSATSSSSSTIAPSSSSIADQKYGDEDVDTSWLSNTVPPSAQVTSSDSEDNQLFPSRSSEFPSSTERGDHWMFSDDKLPACKAEYVRNISWNMTFPGDIGVMPCPGGATGLAHWRCQRIDSDTVIRFPEMPDLSECRSVWLTSLENRVLEGDSITKIAGDLSQVTENKALYGGDVMIACKLIKDMVQKMSKDILTFPDRMQREAVVKDLLNSVVKISSNVLDSSALPSWQDLPYLDQMRIATLLLVGLEENSFLLASTISKEDIVTYCTKNILLMVRVLETRNVPDGAFSVTTPTGLPTCDVTSGNIVQLQKSSLMENSESGGIVTLLYIAFDSLDNILNTPQQQSISGGGSVGGISRSGKRRIINSKILSASLGKGRHIQLYEPVTLYFEHLKTTNVSNPSCVFWDYTQNLWSEEGCLMVSTNYTHTICQCNHLTSFAILVDVVGSSEMPNEFFSYFSLSIIFVILSIVISIFLGIYFCIKNNQNRRKEYGSGQGGVGMQDNVFSFCCPTSKSSTNSEKTLNIKNHRPSLYGGGGNNNSASQNLDIEQITIQPTHVVVSSNTLPRSIENHYPPPAAKLNHSNNYSTYGRNGSIRKIKEARRLEHIENALQQHRNRILSSGNSPRSHTYSEIVAGGGGATGTGGASTRSDPVYEEIEREKEHFSQVSDISDEDGGIGGVGGGKRHQLGDMSRQSSKSYGDHRPLIPYNAAVQDRNFHAALDAAFKQQLKEQNSRTVSVLDGQTVVCHLQQPTDPRMLYNTNKSLRGHPSSHHY